VDVGRAALLPADAVLFQAAHVSRTAMPLVSLDPSVRNEDDPDDRDPELDLYEPRNPDRPPYAAGYIERFRAAQRHRRYLVESRR
jgi:hypothetical protein